MKKYIAAIGFVIACMLFGNVAHANPEYKQTKVFAQLSEESKKCASCHEKKNRGLHQQWGRSKHYGANVGCYECHAADKDDKDAIKHKNKYISVIVSPKDCAQCHPDEVKEFSASHHADAGKILGSLDNFLAEVVEGQLSFNGQSAVAVSGCWQCHGSEVKVLENGDLDPTTFPNTGIGRINPDGSIGSCTACHQRHEFSLEQARRPEACGKCHLGPDHPQKEVYEESKHGINFYANVDRMNLDNSKWIVGEDYDAAPTCATCHMSATKKLPITHDVGDRISWTLRPAISEKVDAKAIAQGKEVKPWEDRRDDMKKVCTSCHTSQWTENFYEQFDNLVVTYNEKFAKPGKSLMGFLTKAKLLTEQQFDEEIEWTWFYLWHHEGRRARHGAAMMAPDYVQWHGMFEVAERFYIELIPQYREILHHAKEEGNEAAFNDGTKLLDEILSRPEHLWFTGNETHEVKSKRKKAQQEFKKRYLSESK